MGGKRFKDLTDEDKEYAYSVYKDTDMSWDDRMEILKNFFGKSERTVRKWCSEKLGFSEKEEEVPEQFEIAKTREYDKTKKRFLITWGQCNTRPHIKFLRNMEAYAEFIDADLHVIAGRYRNPTSLKREANGKVEEVWDEKLLPYLDANRHNIHKHVSILSDIKTQPTAVTPMTGLEAISGTSSCIFGSPKVQMKTVPVLEGENPKIMMLSGACTVANYTETKAGKKGEFHHTLGFVIVEIKDDDHYYMRQVTANKDDGSFNDLYFNVTNEIVTRNETIAAAILGDIHIGETDETVIDLTLNTLFKKLKPENVVLHDLFDGHSISHHEAKDPFKLYRREKDGTNSLKREIDEMLTWLEQFKEYKVTVVRSNHDDFLDRWLINADWKRNIKNSLEYIRYSAAILEGKAPKGIIPYIIDERFPEFNTLDRRSSFKVGKWELGNHGDVGANGSRGSLLQFKRLNTKCVIGHYHSPGRVDGALSVGTSTELRVDYNIGPSSWLQSHVIIHNDGKAQHINFTGDDIHYTTFE